MVTRLKYPASPLLLSSELPEEVDPTLAPSAFIISSVQQQQIAEQKTRAATEAQARAAQQAAFQASANETTRQSAQQTALAAERRQVDAQIAASAPLTSEDAQVTLGGVSTGIRRRSRFQLAAGPSSVRI